jgi:hypothetical protein
MSKRIRLVCWNEELAAERARALAKFDLDSSPFHISGMVTRARKDPPALFLIDLDRLPSHGREVAVALRNSKALREIPIVFAGGAEEKVSKIQGELPDAVFTPWAKVAAAIAKALKSAPVLPARPVTHMQRSATSSLATKLGLEAGAKVLLIGAEEGFLDLLGDLPEDLEMQSHVTADTTLMLWFVRTQQDFVAAFEITGARMVQACSLWIIYPKKAGRYKVDFNGNDIRAAGIAAGLVDYKICAVDADWSGMKFARRKT